MDRLTLPSVEPLLYVPVPAIAELVANRSEAEVLLRIGMLAHEFDHLMTYLAQWLEHQQCLRVDCLPADGESGSQASSLAPLTYQARLANRHGVKALQQRVTECLQKLQRHMDAVQVYANQNASFAQELRLCGLGARADQRRRLAETEAELAKRISKFLGGCDSFYDEQPLAVALKLSVEAAGRGGGAAAPQVPPGVGIHSAGLAPVPTTAGNLGGRKRPRPTGDFERDDIRKSCDSDDRGAEGSAIARGQDTATAAGHHGDRTNPGTVWRNRREQGVSIDDRGERYRKRATDAGEPGKGGPNNALAGEETDDGFMAPSFLTPPVIAVETGAGVPGTGAPIGVAPPSACSSAGSTPSNGSSSPALAVASPTPKRSRRVGGGRAGDDGVLVDGGRPGDKGNGSGMLDGAGPGFAPLSQDRPSLSSSQTQPSTREPSPPPLSTQEGSSSADGENDKEEVDEFVTVHGDKGERARNDYSSAVERPRKTSGGAGNEPDTDGKGRDNAAIAMLAPADPTFASDLSCFALRPPGRAVDGKAISAREGSAKQAAEAKRKQLGGDGQGVQLSIGGGSEGEEGGDEQEEGEDEEDDVADTADTVEERATAAAAAETGQTCGTSMDLQTRRRVLRETPGGTHGDTLAGALGVAVAGDDGSMDAREGEQQEEETPEEVASASCFGSQGASGADEAGGTETETDTGGPALMGGQTRREIAERPHR